MKAKKKKKVPARKPGIKNNKGQMLPVVIMIGAILSIFAYSMLFLFRNSQKMLVMDIETTKKYELGYMALEHTLYKLGAGSSWYMLPMATGFKYDAEYTVDGIGTYTIMVMKGNRFLTSLSDPSSTQGQSVFRTIGIKVKTQITKSTKQFYAVVKKANYGGPLISKGFINLCNSEAYTSGGDLKYNFYWGDIYSAKTAAGSCRLPSTAVGGGTSSPQPWLPEVYAASDIMTVKDTSGNYGFFYNDMSPTAHSHPYSPYAVAPEIDFDYFKMLAFRNGAYYGPANVNGSANPYYIAGGCCDLVTLTARNLKTKLVDKLNSPTSTVFIDTTDGNPITKYEAGITTYNTYTGTITNTVSSPQSISIFANDSNQWATRGNLFVMGPLSMMGDDASAGMPANYTKVTIGVAVPDNFYYPQSSTNHFTNAGSNLYIDKVKHFGLLYVGGEFTIGGPQPGVSGGWGGAVSDVCIFGTVFIGEYGSFTTENTADSPLFYIYYNKNMNMFGYMGDKIDVVSFNELTWLIPTPNPVYPVSF